MLPLRDGVRLATDIYLPESGEPVAVLLERTPYDKSGVSRAEIIPERETPLTRPEVARFFTEHGYAVAMQDCRGRYASEGDFVKYVNEAEDGYDTIAWLSDQAWCDGRVATFGLSYGAHTQLAAACLGPPALACMFMDSGGFSSAFHGGIRRGGAFELKQVTWAHRHAMRLADRRKDTALIASLSSRDLQDWFRDMPWEVGNSPLTPAPDFESYLFDQWRSGLFDERWRRPGLYAEAYYHKIPAIPVCIVGSWYDPYILACITHFQRLRENGNERVRLLLGPWTHGDRSLTHAGSVDFGSAARLEGNIAQDYLRYRLEWFDRWLQNPDAAPEQRPVRYFRMGGGQGGRNADGRVRHGGGWFAASQWPPAGERLRMYLHGSGQLSADPPADAGFKLEYQFDPNDPVPTIGGAITSGDPVMAGGAFDQRVVPSTFTYRKDAPCIPLSRRKDVLVFETEVLEEDLDVTGSVTAQLWVSSDRPDTDFAIKLIDVHPPCEGSPEEFAMNICDGILRARFREGFEHEAFMEPEAIYCIRVAAFPTSNVFKKGHRVRLDVSSSNFPQFDINPNSGAPCGTGRQRLTATNAVHCSAEYPSYIELSVLTRTEAGSCE